MVLSFRTSFVGHLAGILVGLLYTAGPLKAVMKKCAGQNLSLWLFFVVVYTYVCADCICITVGSCNLLKAD